MSAQKPFAAGTRVRLRIIHRGAVFAPLGHIVSVRKNGMGVVFTKIEQKDQALLEKWLGDVRDQHERTPSTRQASR